MFSFLGGKKYVRGYPRPTIPGPRFLVQSEVSPWFDFTQESHAFIAYAPRLQATSTYVVKFYQKWMAILQNQQFQRSRSFAKHLCWIQFYNLLKIYWHLHPDNNGRFVRAIDDCLFGKSQQLSLPILLAYCHLMDVFIEMENNARTSQSRSMIALKKKMLQRFPSINALRVHRRCILPFPYSIEDIEEKESEEPTDDESWQQQQTKQWRQQQQQDDDKKLNQELLRFGFPLLSILSRR